MDKNVTQFVVTRANEFLAALGEGKVRWTPAELASFFLESKKKQERVTVPELGLGPVDEARAPLVARIVASLLGAGVEYKEDGFIFRVPEGAKAQIPTVVEKVVVKEVPVERVVEKIVEVPGKGGGKHEQVRVEFPELPTPRKALAAFQEPAWYVRMKAVLDAGKHVRLAGPPGIGKSTAPEIYFIRRNQPFVIVNGDAGFRRRDIEGSVEISAGSTFFKVAEFAAAAINGWGCILNEINAADPDALLWLNGILEEKIINIHGKAYPVHKDFRLAVTYNPGLVGTKPLPEALKDRFFAIKLGFPHRDFLRKVVVAKTGCASYAPYLDRLLKYAEDCWAAHEKGSLRYQISPRRLFDAVFLMDTGLTNDVEIAIKQAIVDAVDSAADVQLLTKLVTSPGAIPMAGSRFGLNP
jgi:MoxR-like ATPase